jgi:hypothetical protein
MLSSSTSLDWACVRCQRGDTGGGDQSDGLRYDLMGVESITAHGIELEEQGTLRSTRASRRRQPSDPLPYHCIQPATQSGTTRSRFPLYSPCTEVDHPPEPDLWHP